MTDVKCSVRGSKPLPDILEQGLKVLFVGFNPGLRSAEKGHHYAGPSNRFWQFLFTAGLTPEKLDYSRDWQLPEYGYGSTNIVDRPSRAASEITREEYLAGRESLRELLDTYRPLVACYVGAGVYKAFVGRERQDWGRQPNQIVNGVIDFVAPSPSGLNRIPLAQQIEVYKTLKELIQELAPKDGFDRERPV